MTTEDWRDCLTLPLTWKRSSDNENTLLSGNLLASAGKTVFTCSTCDVGEHVLSTFMCMYCVCLYVYLKYLYYNIFINTRSYIHNL